MTAEREYKYTLKERATDFWHRIFPPSYCINEQGFYHGEVAGYPSIEDGQLIVHPVRVELDPRKSGDVFTSLDLGYANGGGDNLSLQRVLPGWEGELSLAVDEIRRRFRENIRENNKSSSVLETTNNERVIQLQLL